MTLVNDTCDGCGGRFDPMGDPDLTKRPEIGPYAVFCGVCQSKAEPQPTFSVPKAQYDHLIKRVKELEHLPRALEMANNRADRWKRRHDLLVQSHEELLAQLKEIKAEAWDEGYRAFESVAGPYRYGDVDNPYREAS